jgi:serine protease AprX
MDRKSVYSFIAVLSIVFAIGAIQYESPSSESTVEVSSTTMESASYIVQAESLEIAKRAVETIGAEITHELGIINAVGATLSSAQLTELSKDSRLRIQADRDAGVAGPAPSTMYPTLSAAADLHNQGIDGLGVTVAVIDSGFWEKGEISKDPYGNLRVLAQYDAIEGNIIHADDEGKHESTDEYGHGSHITSIILDRKTDSDGDYMSIAPAANLVTVRAFDDDGNGSYLDVIRGLDWVLNNKANFDIRVVNLSFSAEPQSHYWDDPINQAVMALWQDGIVVVASAGNNGPDAMTIGVPGNVPYVITVGAITDYGTPFYAEDDQLTSFSAAGPTVEGFV